MVGVRDPIWDEKARGLLAEMPLAEWNALARKAVVASRVGLLLQFLMGVGVRWAGGELEINGLTIIFIVYAILFVWMLVKQAQINRWTPFGSIYCYFISYLNTKLLLSIRRIVSPDWDFMGLAFIVVFLAYYVFFEIRLRRELPTDAEAAQLLQTAPA